MKGLLLKDYYLIRSVLYIILIVFAVVGIGMSFLTSAWVLTVIATVTFGMITITTINIDKSSGWIKVSGVFPVSRKTIMDSKYILYLLLSSIGLLLGIIFSVLTSLFKGQIDAQSMLLFISISIIMALFSGSITIPTTFLLSEEKSMLGLIGAYPLSTVIFVGIVIIFDNEMAACVVAVLMGVAFYAVSWYLSRKIIAGKEIA